MVASITSIHRKEDLNNLQVCDYYQKLKKMKIVCIMRYMTILSKMSFVFINGVSKQYLIIRMIGKRRYNLGKGGGVLFLSFQSKLII